MRIIMFIFPIHSRVMWNIAAVRRIFARITITKGRIRFLIITAMPR